MRVGVVGLGLMGGRAAEALAGAGHPVVGCDVSDAARERAASRGLRTVAAPQDAAEGADVVLLSLPAGEQVEAAMTVPSGVLARADTRCVVVDLSTVAPTTTRRMAAAARERGVAYLDAPVLGRPRMCGRWTLAVGGDETALERARPVLQVLATKIIRVGASGSGNALKLLNALMFGAINAVTAEVLALAPRVGVSRRLFVETVEGSSAATVSPLFREVGAKILERDFTPVFTLDHLWKDNGLGLAMVREAGAPAVLSATTQLLNELGRVRGYGAEDTSALVKLYEDLFGMGGDEQV